MLKFRPYLRVILAVLGLTAFAIALRFFGDYIRTTVYHSTPNLQLSVNTTESSVAGDKSNLAHAQVVLKDGREAKYGGKKYIDIFKQQYFTAVSPSPAASLEPLPSGIPSGSIILDNRPKLSDGEKDSGWYETITGRAFNSSYYQATGEPVGLKYSWTGDRAPAGEYFLYVTWPSQDSLPDAHSYEIKEGGSVQANLALADPPWNEVIRSGNTVDWHRVGPVTLSGNGNFLITLTSAWAGVVKADAVMLVPKSAAPSPSVSPSPSPSPLVPGAIVRDNTYKPDLGAKYTGTHWSKTEHFDAYDGDYWSLSPISRNLYYPWDFGNIPPGKYTIFATWPGSKTAPENPPEYIVSEGDNTLLNATFSEDTWDDAIDGFDSLWRPIGQVTLHNGQNVKVSAHAYYQHLQADAIALVPGDSPVPSRSPSPLPSTLPHSDLVGDDMDPAEGTTVTFGHVGPPHDHWYDTMRYTEGRIVDDITAFLGRFFGVPRNYVAAWQFKKLIPGEYDVYLTWPKTSTIAPVMAENLSCEMFEKKEPHFPLNFEGDCSDSWSDWNQLGRGNIDQSKQPQGPVIDNVPWQKLGTVEVEDGRDVQFRTWSGTTNTRASWEFKNIPPGNYRVQYHWNKQPQRIFGGQWGYSEKCPRDGYFTESYNIAISDSYEYYSERGETTPSTVGIPFENVNTGWVDAKFYTTYGANKVFTNTFRVEKGDSVIFGVGGIRCPIAIPADAVRLIGNGQTYEVDNSDPGFEHKSKFHWKEVSSAEAINESFREMNSAYLQAEAPVAADGIRLVPRENNEKIEATLLNSDLHFNSGEDIKVRIENVDPADVLCAYVLYDTRDGSLRLLGDEDGQPRGYLGDVYGNVPICDRRDIPNPISFSGVTVDRGLFRIDTHYSRRYVGPYGPEHALKICPTPYKRYFNLQ